jgi:hypothetical protein
MRGGLVFNLSLKGLMVLLLTSMASSTLWALEDPTRPPRASVAPQKDQAAKVATSATKKTWSLDSILIAKERRIAVINGVIVKKGKRVNGARVVSIKKSSVTLYKKGKYFKLSLVSKSKTGHKNR